MTAVTSNSFNIIINNDPYASLTQGVWTQLPILNWEGFEGGIMAFGNTTWDQAQQRIMFFGGGDQDWWGNEVWDYYTTTNSLFRHYAPDYMGAGIGIEQAVRNTDPLYPGMWMPSGRPISRHVGGGNVYMAHRDEMLIGGDSTFRWYTNYWPIVDESRPPGIPWDRNGPTPVDNGTWFMNPGDCWHYHTASHQWTYKGSNRQVPGVVYNETTGLWDPIGVVQSLDGGYYDSVARVVWGSSKTVSAGEYETRFSRWGKYDPEVGLWTNLGSPPATDRWSSRTGCWDSLRRRVIGLTLSTAQISIFDAPTQTWSVTIANGTPPPTSDGELAGAYASALDSMIVLNRSSLFALNLTTMTWSTITNVVPPGLANIPGKLHYDTARNMLFIMYVTSTGSLRCYGYKF